VVCFIDVLDECDEDEVRNMMSFFERVAELAITANVRFHVCFSSRHYTHITIAKGVEINLGCQNGHSQDISDRLH
jgi:hypothetical protein